MVEKTERFTPCFKLEVDGVDRTRSIWEYLESIQYDDAEGGESDSLSFTVANAPVFAIPETGVEVRFWLGYKESGMKFFGTFKVDEVAINLNPATMSVTAKSADFGGGSTEKERHDKEWEKVSLADIARKLAAKFGYDAKVDVDVNYSHVAQTNESDLSFLKRIAGKIGAKLALRDKTVTVYAPNKGSRPSAAIRYSDTVSGSFTVKAREDYGEVEASWWDDAEATEKSVTAQNPSSSGKAKHVLKEHFGSASEAQTAANNVMEKMRRGKFAGDLTLPGDPSIVADAEITLSGFKPESVNGRYIAKSVNHSITKSGWTTAVNLESLG